MIDTDPKTQEALHALLEKIDIASLKTEDILADVGNKLRIASAQVYIASVLIEQKAKLNSESAPEAAPEQAEEDLKS
jgi:hypothetical protein